MTNQLQPTNQPTTVGGNHEAANHLWELYYGGWAAPNIYFLGFTGCVRFGGLRIAGLSGIYKQVGGVTLGVRWRFRVGCVSWE